MFLLLINGAFAQEVISISGKVVSETQEPLIGVTIKVKGTSAGTVTDLDGNFKLSAAPDAVLIFTYVGFATIEVLVNNQAVINQTLNADIKALDEVVVVGYGQQKKASTIASISQVKGDDLLKVGGVTSVSSAIQGLLPGVIAVVDDGKPGREQADILIRGKASWVSSTPLTLVDGVERSIDDIDPNEIESLSVLKDASATAVFGVKGANGVILVTTKRGSIKKTSVNFTANFGFKQPTASPEFADPVTAMNMWNQTIANDGYGKTLIPTSKINAWQNALNTGNYGPYNDYFPNVNWWDEIVKKVGYEQQYNINVSGGTEFVRYFASLGYLYDGDIFKSPPSDLFDPSFYYKRYNWRTNFDFSLTKTTTFSVNLSGKVGYRNQNGYRINDGLTEGDDSYGQPQFFQSLYNAPRNTFPIKWSDGEYAVDGGGGGNLIVAFSKGSRTYKYYQNFVDASLKQDLDFITKGLKVQGKISFNAESNTTSRVQLYTGGNFGPDPVTYTRSFDYSAPTANGGYALASSKRWPENSFQGDRQEASYDETMLGGYDKKLYYEFALNYEKSFKKHNITFLALMNRNEDRTLNDNSNQVLKFLLKDEGWVSRLTYNWNERYLFEFNGAYQGTQKFAAGKRFDFFPSLSVGWRVSEEPFVKQIAGKFLNNLKIRYGYGKVGYYQSAMPFTYLQQYNNAGGNVSLGDTTKFNYGPLYTEGATANVNATWELSKKQNLGFEITVLQNLNISLDLYQENRSQILQKKATPGWSGIEEPDANIGETKNHGYELEVGYNGKIGSNFRYRIKGNYTFNENRIVYNNDARNEPQYLQGAGKPIGIQREFVVAGYYQSLDDIFNGPVANDKPTQMKLIPGDFRYVDYNGDGIIDGNANVAANTDMVPKSLTYPSNTYGLILSFGFKRFDVTIQFYGVSNVYKDADGLILWDLQGGSAGNYMAGPNVTGSWTPEHAATAIKPVLHSNDYTTYSMRGGTTYSFQDASYLRLKSVELSYSVPNKLLKFIGIESLQLYGNGNNLFTFTKFDKRMDPERKNASVYPIVKRYDLGLRVSF